MDPFSIYKYNRVLYGVINIEANKIDNKVIASKIINLQFGDEYNYWGRRNLFWGRKPEEIKFKPGDVVEILGCPGNDFWGNESVDLAIVVKTPPTVAEVEEMRKQYFATHSGFDLCDNALSFEFDDRLDTYEVIPYALGGIDHAPTICVFEPTKQVSLRRKKALMEMYKKYGKDN